jgi:hypothetical protein
MAQKKDTGAPQPTLDRAALSRLVTEMVQAAPGITAARLKTAVAKRTRPQADEAVALARDLAARGELHRWTKAKTECFYPSDPLAALDAAARSALSPGAMTEPLLKQALKRSLPGHVALYATWRPGAVARQIVFPHEPPAESKHKLFGATADPRLILKPARAALAKCLPLLDRYGVGRDAAASVLLAELGVGHGETPATSPHEARSGGGSAPRDAVLAAVRATAARQPQGALLRVSSVRSEAGLAKSDFDDAAMALYRDGTIVLHPHDYPTSLSQAERDALVRDESGTHYIGVALRGAP